MNDLAQDDYMPARSKKPKSMTMPVPPYENKDVLAMAVRRSDPKATEYVIAMVRFHKGHVTNAARAIGISHRVIYKWAAANPKFRAELVDVAHKKGKRPKIEASMKPGIWRARGKKSFTEIATEHGVSVSCISRVMAEDPKLQG